MTETTDKNSKRGFRRILLYVCAWRRLNPFRSEQARPESSGISTPSRSHRARRKRPFLDLP
jgi:hypothetical protein